MTETRHPYFYVKESEFKATVVEYAVLHGWLVYSVPDSRKVFPRVEAGGYPDLTMARCHRLVVAEVKREGKRPTQEQEEWLELLRGVPGVEVYVWEPSDWERVQVIME